MKKLNQKKLNLVKGGDAGDLGALAGSLVSAGQGKNIRKQIS